MAKGYFQTLPPEQRKLIGQKGGQSQRTQVVQDAWNAQVYWQNCYKDGASVKELAKKAGISERTMFRIVRGK